MYLGIGDLDVPWALGVYRGPPEVYRGPCMKNMCWKTPIIFTYGTMFDSLRDRLGYGEDMVSKTVPRGGV